ncbi:MAG: hypothetical protein LBE21_04935 [Pseudomonadales bacterium]|jgi:hypothetical protein|nr:hypothetical protein [Pseudomonadales bacterium]
MKAHPSSLRHLLLLLLLSFTLIGVQLVQDSPLHVHAQHTVDCALCHFQLSDDTEYTPQFQLCAAPDCPRLIAASVAAIIDFTPLPYQSRAPPQV